MKDKRKNELLSFIGINTGLITDFIKMLDTSDSPYETMADLLKIYQENEVYRNEVESIMQMEITALETENTILKLNNL